MGCYSNGPVMQGVSLVVIGFIGVLKLVLLGLQLSAL